MNNSSLAPGSESCRRKGRFPRKLEMTCPAKAPVETAPHGRRHRVRGLGSKERMIESPSPASLTAEAWLETEAEERTWRSVTRQPLKLALWDCDQKDDRSSLQFFLGCLVLLPMLPY